MPNWTSIRIALVSIVVCSDLTGCGSGCTVIACNPHAEVYFDDVVQGPGKYIAEVETGDGVVTCDATFPLSGSDGCSGANVWWIVSGPESKSGLWEAEGPADTITGVHVAGEHELIQVRLYREGVVLGEASVRPRYIGEEINGPGCGKCPIATEQIPMP